MKTNKKDELKRALHLGFYLLCGHICLSLAFAMILYLPKTLEVPFYYFNPMVSTALSLFNILCVIGITWAFLTKAAQVAPELLTGEFRND